MPIYTADQLHADDPKPAATPAQTTAPEVKPEPIRCYDGCGAEAIIELRVVRLAANPIDCQAAEWAAVCAKHYKLIREGGYTKRVRILATRALPGG